MSDKRSHYFSNMNENSTEQNIGHSDLQVVRHSVDWNKSLLLYFVYNDRAWSWNDELLMSLKSEQMQYLGGYMSLKH